MHLIEPFSTSLYRMNLYTASTYLDRNLYAFQPQPCRLQTRIPSCMPQSQPLGSKLSGS